MFVLALHTHTPWPSPWLSLVFVVRVHVVRVVGQRPMLLPLLLPLPLPLLLPPRTLGLPAWYLCPQRL